MTEQSASNAKVSNYYYNAAPRPFLRKAFLVHPDKNIDLIAEQISGQGMHS